jgi:DNA-directed RNA polymerase specialized sigma24 family protein
LSSAGTGFFSSRNCLNLTANGTLLLSVIVGVSDTREADDALRQLYAQHAEALHNFVWRFCPDRASADDIVQETFIRAWQHLPQLRADSRPIRPWLFRVARNLLTDADRAAQARPVTATVARQLGIPDGTARSRLHYALHALRRHLQDRDIAA